MDQDTVVSEQRESGQRLIDALAGAGFEVRVALWAKPSDEGKLFLYIASPVVDEQGPAVAYRKVHDVMRRMSDVRIDPLDIRVVGLGDTLAQAALEVTRPRTPGSPFAVRNPTPYPGITRFGGSTLGGVSIEGPAYIYSPQIAATSK